MLIVGKMACAYLAPRSPVSPELVSALTGVASPTGVAQVLGSRSMMDKSGKEGQKALRRRSCGNTSRHQIFVLVQECVCTRACAGVVAQTLGGCPVATHTGPSELVDLTAEKFPASPL